MKNLEVYIYIYIFAADFQKHLSIKDLTTMEKQFVPVEETGKKVFGEPMIEVIKIEVSDIIATSPLGVDNPFDGTEEDW